MQHAVHNRATIRVADRTDVSGRANADEINGGLRTGKETSFWRIASSIVLGSLMAAGLFVASTPMPARADEDKDIHRGGADNDKEIRVEIATLKAQVADLQNQVNTLQASNTALKSQLAAVQSNHVLLLGPFVRVDPNPEIGVIGPNIIFSGANIHIVSGSGTTDDNGNPTGLGNLIIGYDEEPSTFGLLVGGGAPLLPGDRGGSHNLVIGGGNRFISEGGLVAGQLNTLAGFGASVTGGSHNMASGFVASVSGGFYNTASGTFASGGASSVSGGSHNTASGGSSSVSGGLFNTASGDFASVSAGASNTASGELASVSGGGGSPTPSVPGNTASGSFSSILGGQGNTASGDHAVLLGGTNVIDNNANSIAPQPPFP